MDVVEKVDLDWALNAMQPPGVSDGELVSTSGRISRRGSRGHHFLENHVIVAVVLVIIVSILGPHPIECLTREAGGPPGTGRMLLAAKKPNESSDLVQPEIITEGVDQNVTAAKGTTAYLECRVKNLGTRAVSWMRKRDLHVLTSGIFTYTSDPRFRAVQGEGYESTSRDEDWKLEIKSLRSEDAGLYECQVNTEPKLGLLYRLIVTDLQVNILGQKPDIYVKEGSMLNLTCAIVSGGVNEPLAVAGIQWLKDGQEIESNVAPDGKKWSQVSHRIKNNHSRHKPAKVTTLRRTRHQHDSDSIRDDVTRHHPSWTMTAVSTTENSALASPSVSTPVIITKLKLSRLIVLHATKQDSGVYQCVPPHGNASQVFVHIIQGENSAAMQHGDPSGAATLASDYKFALSLTAYLIYFPFYSCC
ncbi:unnamed protein product [Notodromas monacha]|uniref:Ig-like domain-containing protein n=1 Tax=Notodromas monacha TaxID=399045 RepID=A0A7R9BCL8_9CRUS|nr:unnamed protein product [Notodromas monacha]CAG0912313.1 unnamed protein product [Notodromas monacha]